VPAGEFCDPGREWNIPLKEVSDWLQSWISTLFGLMPGPRRSTADVTSGRRSSWSIRFSMSRIQSAPVTCARHALEPPVLPTPS
jgi:hypothetical protein